MGRCGGLGAKLPLVAFICLVAAALAAFPGTIVGVTFLPSI